VPDLHDRIFPIIQSTARAAAQACSGTSDLFHGHQGQACGFRWLPAQFDGQVGIGEQMNALSAFMYLLVDKVKPPATGDNGGTSSGDPNAGSVSDDDKRKIFRDITVADRVGAGILTTLILAGLIAGCLFVTREGGIKDGSW
jgi:mannan endo-1,6-alpha-mannosidase